MRTYTFGPAYDEACDHQRLLTQLEVIRDVLLSAAECAETMAHYIAADGADLRRLADEGGWMTLRELADLTCYGEASISAQLRHLRKPQYGGFALEKRQREGVVVRGTESGTVWEYQLRRKIRRTFQRASMRGWGERLAAMPAVC